MFVWVSSDWQKTRDDVLAEGETSTMEALLVNAFDGVGLLNSYFFSMMHRKSFEKASSNAGAAHYCSLRRRS